MSIPAATNALETTIHDATGEDIGRIVSEGTRVPVDLQAYLGLSARAAQSYQPLAYVDLRWPAWT